MAGWTSGKIKHIEDPWSSGSSDAFGNSSQSNHVEPTVLINPQKAWDLLQWKPSHLGIMNALELYYQTWKAHKET